MSPVDDTKIRAARKYLDREFQGCSIAEKWDGDREAQTFRIDGRDGVMQHLVTVSREFLDDHMPEEIDELLTQYNASVAIRKANRNRVLVTSRGLEVSDMPRRGKA